MPDILTTVAHRTYPLPTGPWRMSQRWNDLLFAHWPISADAMGRLLPPSLQADTFDGYAWAGVVPFRMDRVRIRVTPARTITIPTAQDFCELNLRTYVRSRATGLPGVFFFSLDAASALAVLGARTLFHLPYYLARMQSRPEPGNAIRYRSQRLLSHRRVEFWAKYRSLQATSTGTHTPAPVPEPAKPQASYKPPTSADHQAPAEAQSTATPPTPAATGTLEHFLTERYCLFTTRRGRLLVGDIHHLPWPLEPAEAEIARNDLPAAHGIALPDRPPVLHFARELQVFIWPLREDR